MAKDLLSFFPSSPSYCSSCINLRGKLQSQLILSIHGVSPHLQEAKYHLVDNIQFACSETNCNPIQPRGACFQPNTTLSHASVAMNLYYQAKGRNSWDCNFNGSGLIVSTDPSYGSCKISPFS